MRIFSFFKKILSSLEEALSEEHLIIFDQKVLVLFLLSFILFFFLVFLKIHGSSIPIWNQIITQNNISQKADRIFGWPEGVRSDEWDVSTPFALSQVQTNPKFSLHNKTLGEGNVPLLMNLPVKHPSTLFKPQLWGYFFLDTERGFSFFWDFEWLILFLGFFFLFMLLTRNQFWLSIFGSIWIFFSSFTQWWFSSVATMFGVFAIVFVALVYLILSRKKVNIISSAILMVVFGIDFVLFLYPPFQVQLGYLTLFLLVAFIFQYGYKKNFLSEINLKTVCTMVGLTIAAGVFYSFYIDAKDTMKIMMGTVYPGSRRSLGGGINASLFKYFSGFYSGLMRDGHVPKALLNASEASNFILLYPLLVIGVTFNFVRKQKNNWLVMLMLLYTLIITWWMKFGFPAWLAGGTLLDFVPTERCYLGLGLASIIATVVFLGTKSAILKSKKQIVVAGSLIFTALLTYGFYLTSQTEHFFRLRYIILLTIGFTATAIFLLQKKRLLFAFSILFVVVIPGIFINPISVGLGPIFNKDLTGAVKAEDMKNPNAKWAVYGNRLLPNFFIATGAKVFDGAKYTPPLDDLKVLDPAGQYNNIYNRFAHLGMSDKKLKGQEVTFELVVADYYVIHIDPCSSKLKQLGITDLAFDEKPSDSILSCATPINAKPANLTWLYRYKK